MELLLKASSDQDIGDDTLCMPESTRTVTKGHRNVKDTVKNMVKIVYRDLRNSDAGRRLRERIYQSPEHSMSSIECDLLGEVLHHILLEIAGYTDGLWHLVQSMVVVMHRDTHFEVRRIHRSGCSALRHVYARYADSEDNTGVHIAPRSAPSWLITRKGGDNSFRATSWYTIRATCRLPAQKKPLGFDIKVGISVAAASSYSTGLLLGEKMDIKCLTPSLIPGLASSCSSRRCMR